MLLLKDSYLAVLTFMIENSMGPAYSGISIQAFLITE